MTTIAPLEALEVLRPFFLDVREWERIRRRICAPRLPYVASAIAPEEAPRRPHIGPGVHAVDPSSSQAAAEGHQRASATNRAIVLAAVRQFPGMTAAELLQEIHREGLRLLASEETTEVRRRLNDLMNLGKVSQGDVRECRATRPNGVRHRKARLAVTWVPA